MSNISWVCLNSVWIHYLDLRDENQSAHPLLVVDPPLVILLDHHLNPPLPVAALQHDRLRGANTHI